MVFRLNIITASILSIAGATNTAFAQEVSNEPTMDVVVALGTKRTDVTSLQSTSPVKVVTSESLEKTGSTHLLSALQTLLPSANFPAGANSGNEAWNGKSISLRGLSPSYTLVLVNGKRYHPTSVVKQIASYDQGAQSVDLNTIPISAIDHVEVLTDGASALYGSDAVAGVVNIVLRKDKEGSSVTTQFGAYDGGKGFERQISGWSGIALPNQGYLNYGGDLSDNQGLDSFGEDDRRYYSAGDPREASVDRDIPLMGAPKRNDGHVFINGEMGLSDDLRVYGLANYSKRRAIASLGPLLPASSSNVPSIYPDGSQAKTNARTEDFNIQGGLKKSLENWGNLDFSVVYGQNTSKRTNFDTINTSLGAASPTKFDISTFKNDQTSIQLDYDNDIPVSYSQSPLNVAAGAAYRKETWESDKGDEASYIGTGAYPNGNQGLSPSDVTTLHREVYSIYGSMEQEVIPALTLGTALRAEDYSDFGSSVTGKVSARYELTDELALRTTFSTGLRAPSLGQEGLSNHQVVYVNNVQSVGLFAPVSSPIAQLLGAKDLKPEKTRNLSAGFVWQPLPNASVTLDGYILNIKDAIVYSGQLTGPYVQNVLASAGYTGINSVNYFTNAIDKQVKGVDFNANYSLKESGDARTDFSLGFSTQRIKVSGIQNNAQLAAAGLQVFNRVAKETNEKGAPDSKLVFNVSQSWKRWSGNMSLVRYGTYVVPNSTNEAYDQKMGAQWVTNLTLSNDVTDQLRLTIGANNVFDTMPDKLNDHNKALNFLPYSSTLGTPTDLGGRFMYASATYSF